MSLLMVIFGVFNLNKIGELFLLSLSCVVFMTPISIFSGVVLFKMWKRKTTKICTSCDEFPNGEPSESETEQINYKINFKLLLIHEI